MTREPESTEPAAATPPAAPTGSRWLPRLTSRWWTVLLGLSLMVNLLVAGMALGHRFAERRDERLTGASYIQLIPRGFLAGLAPDRRKELMDIVRQNRDGLRDLRRTSEAVAPKLADALVAEPFDLAVVKSTVDGFTTGSESLAARGGAIVTEIVSRLTPEERQALAQAIRDRAERASRRKGARTDE